MIQKRQSTYRITQTEELDSPEFEKTLITDFKELSPLVEWLQDTISLGFRNHPKTR